MYRVNSHINNKATKKICCNYAYIHIFYTHCKQYEFTTCLPDSNIRINIPYLILRATKCVNNLLLLYFSNRCFLKADTF